VTNFKLNCDSHILLSIVKAMIGKDHDDRQVTDQIRSVPPAGGNDPFCAVLRLRRSVLRRTVKIMMTDQPASESELRVRVRVSQKPPGQAAAAARRLGIWGRRRVSRLEDYKWFMPYDSKRRMTAEVMTHGLQAAPESRFPRHRDRA
jgi:hypothetical protein